ncbi:uncharacterized protein At4g15970-like isoform X1 [Typha angustifolia]|uniref:uncharacterized protein At4g15970-like isoform X1 n=1 Tax=Typha angustifolia TaxID=59011 RepID=UPI003C2ECE2E
MFPLLLWVTIAIFMILFYLSTNPGGRSSEILTLGNEIHTITIHQKVNETRKIRAKEVNITMASPTIEGEFQDFLSLVRRVAMDDNTVILTEVNEAFAAPGSLLDAFLESFRVGKDIQHLLNHLIIVAMDVKAFDRCKSLHPHCYLLKIPGVSLNSEKVFMSKDYIELVWTKVKLQRLIIESGYNFLFTDVDIMWFRNPLRYISVYADLTLASDNFTGDPEDWKNNAPNTGLVYIKSTKKNAEMLKYWHRARERFPPINEQLVFDYIKHELVGMFNLRIQFVDTAYWGGFCQPKKDFNKICTFHGTCIIGLEAKLHYLRIVLEEWKRFIASSASNFPGS